MKKILDFKPRLCDNSCMIKTIKLTDGKRRNLRPYQKEAVTALSEHYEKKNRATIVHCCRSGKSFTAVAIHKQLKAKTSVVVVPSINLMQQVFEDWKANLPYHKFLFVTSDKSVAKGMTTTNEGKIKEFIKGSRQFVIISTYNSCKRICNAVKDMEDFSFDFLVADEAHRTAGVNLKFSRPVHSDDCIPAKKRLYMTATEKKLSQGILMYAYSDAFKSCMSDEKIYGEVVHEFSFKDGIDKGTALCDYQIVAVGCKAPEKIRAIQDTTNADHTSIEETAKILALERCVDDYDVNHMVSYHTTKAKAINFQKNFKTNDSKWKAFHMNSDHTAEEREKIKEEWKNSEYGLLTNCRCLQEGVNLPVCDSVFFSDVKSSPVDVVQSASRCLTQHSSKGKGFKAKIFIPTFHSEDDSMAEVRATNPYKVLIQLIKVMREKDGRIEAFLYRLSSRGGGVDPNDPENIIQVDGFDGLVDDFYTSLIPFDLATYQDITNEDINEALEETEGDRAEAGRILSMPSENVSSRINLSKQRGGILSKWAKEAHQRTIDDDTIYEAFVDNNGSWSKTSRSLGCSRSFTRIRAMKSPDLMKKCKDFVERVAFISEDDIFKAFVDCDGDKAEAGIKLGKSAGFVAYRWFKSPALKAKCDEWTEANKSKPITNEELFEAIKQAGGNVSEAVKNLGCKGAFGSTRLRANPELAKKVKEWQEENGYDPQKAKGEKISKALSKAWARRKQE